jgi:hypothetical protein
VEENDVRHWCKEQPRPTSLSTSILSGPMPRQDFKYLGQARGTISMKNKTG